MRRHTPPPCSRILRAFPKPRNRKPLLPNRSKGDYVDEGVESSTSKASTREAREPVALGVSRLPTLPAGSPAFWGGEDSLGSYPQCPPVVKQTCSAVQRHRVGEQDTYVKASLSGEVV